MLSAGDAAPDIESDSTEGPVVLSEIEGPVVLFFFPKAGSTVCTREACSFQDELPSFEEVGATVVGVSPNDSLERLETFAENNGLEYPLIADDDGAIADDYDIGGLFGLVDKRVTYVIDDGAVVDAVDGMFRATKHVSGSLEGLGAN